MQTLPDKFMNIDAAYTKADRQNMQMFAKEDFPYLLTHL